MESKWLIESQGDDEMEAYRILEVGNGRAELKYIAMDESGANDLINALNWMDTFKNGMVGIPKKTRAPRKPSITLEFTPATTKKRKSK